MRKILFILFGLFMFTGISNAQALPNLLSTDYIQGNIATTWFSKLNKSIDSINAHTTQMLDKLSVSDTLFTNKNLEKSFARSGGSGLTNPVDSIVTKVQVYDAKCITFDSLEICRSREESPRDANYAFAAGSFNEYLKMGWVDFTVRIKMFGVGVKRLYVVADSAKDVFIVSVYSSSISHHINMDTFSGYCENFFTLGNTANVANATARTIDAGGGTTFAQMRGFKSATPNPYQAGIDLWPQGNADYGYYTIRIFYRAKTTSTSTWFVKIIR